MSLRRTTLVLALSALPACNPYNRDGEFYAGPIDPAKFPIVAANCDCTSVAPNQGDIPNSNCIPITDAVGGDTETPSTACRPWQGLNFQYQFQQGTLIASAAWVKGQRVGYYSFPAPLKTLLDSYTNVAGAAKTRRPLAYVFDNGVDKDSTSCTKPTDYVFDQRRDYIRLDVQANVFGQKQTVSGYPGAALPDDDQTALVGVPPDQVLAALGNTGALSVTYMPAYAEVAVTSNGEDCQGLKSSEGIVKSDKVTLTKDPRPASTSDANIFDTGKPTGKYLAWAILDPGTDVRAPIFSTPFKGSNPADPSPLFPATLYGPSSDPADSSLGLDPLTQLGPQRWGYYNHFLVAYIDGGYIPTTQAQTTAMDGTTITTTVRAKAQTLYVPAIAYIPSTDANGNYVLAPNDPMSGQFVPVGIGYDALEGKRGDAAYSPLCHVIRYPNPDPDTIARSADEAIAIAGGGATDDLGYIYCLQIAQ